MVIQWDNFKAQCPELFAGTPHGQYLGNRLQRAFEEGWICAERAMEAALNHLQEVSLSVDAVDPVEPEGRSSHE
jgi:hypothetical protein